MSIFWSLRFPGRGEGAGGFFPATPTPTLTAPPSCFQERSRHQRPLGSSRGTIRPWAPQLRALHTLRGLPALTAPAPTPPDLPEADGPSQERGGGRAPTLRGSRAHGTRDPRPSGWLAGPWGSRQGSKAGQPRLRTDGRRSPRGRARGERDSGTSSPPISPARLPSSLRVRAPPPGCRPWLDASLGGGGIPGQAPPKALAPPVSASPVALCSSPPALQAQNSLESALGAAKYNPPPPPRSPGLGVQRAARVG